MEPVKIVFEKKTPYGTYRDALYFQADQVPPDDEVERLKQERVDNWIAALTAPPVEVTEEPAEEVPQDG